MSSPHGAQLVLLEADGTVSECSPALEQRLGREVPVGAPLSDVFACGSGLPPCGLVRGVLHVREGTEPVDAEVTPLGRGGSVLRLLPPPDVVPAPDLTATLIAALEAAPDPIAVTTADLGRPGPQFVYVNRAFEDLTGYGRAEVLGRTPRLLQGAETDRPTLDRLRQRLGEGVPFHGATVNYRRDGTSYSLEWKIAPVPGPDGRPAYWVTVQRDTTDRVRAEHAVLTAAASHVLQADRAPDAGGAGHPGIEDQGGGLLVALKALAIRAEATTGVPVTVSFDRLAVPLCPSAERTLYVVARAVAADAVGQCAHAVHLGLTTLQGPLTLTVTVRGLATEHPDRLYVLRRYAGRRGHSVEVEGLELGGYRLSCTSSSA